MFLSVSYLFSFVLANRLASTDTLVHSKTKYRNVNVGENLRCQSWTMTGFIVLFNLSFQYNLFT
jgi:hypothetical protein